MKHHLELLGHTVRDVVSDRIGVVVSISFDLSGCVQGYVAPKADKDGKVADGWWCDTKRLIPTSKKPVTPVASFEQVPGGTKLPAPASKPAP